MFQSLSFFSFHYCSLFSHIKRDVSHGYNASLMSLYLESCSVNILGKLHPSSISNCEHFIRVDLHVTKEVENAL